MVRTMEVRGRTVGRFPIGAGARLEELEQDPHALLARLREREPVSWLPALDGWLVTRRDLAMQVMRDPETFTVDDPRFSTGQVVGSSMLTLDGEEHRRHREPFARPFRLAAVRERFTEAVAQETERLIDAIEPAGTAELRSSLTGPLAVAVVTNALGFEDADIGAVLGWYERIVAAVLLAVEREHAGADDLAGGEARVVDGERLRVPHHLHREVAAGDEPPVEHGQPRHRLLFAQAREHRMRVLLELFQADAHHR